MSENIMEVFLKNDGSYGETAIGKPVLVDYKPVGFISDVTPSEVICTLFKRFIGREQASLNTVSKKQDITAVYIDTQ